jgi:preprotein translocase subunit YajC
MILAQNPPPTQQDSPGMDPLLIGLVLMLVVYFGIMLSGNRKEKKQRSEMLANIGRNDRVMTVGGIIGSVVSTNEDDSTVTVKIDESANVKITVVRSAIQKVLREDEKPSEVR